GGSQVTVEVGASGGAVLVTVEDYAGPAAPQAEAGHPPLPGGGGQAPGGASEPRVGSAGGAGMVGMRERVAGFGGEVSAGPADDHPGWRVRARIPHHREGEGGTSGWW